MDRRTELKQLYKETKIDAGVYQIRNTRNNKILVTSTQNLKTLNGKRFELETGHHFNKLLQEDLQEFGPQAFEFEVLQILEKSEEPFFDEKKALKDLEAIWLEKLQPFGERGYNQEDVEVK